MNEILETVAKMSFAGVVAGCVLIPLKYILQKCLLPRKILFCLWAIIGIRLICPVMPQAQLSIFNIANIFENELIAENSSNEYANNQTISPVSTKIIQGETTANDQAPKTNYITYIYVAGVFVILALGALSYIMTKHKLRFAVKKEDNIYISDKISTAFVLGVVKPKIYVPEGIESTTYTCMVAHEKAHLRRRDNISKIVAHIILSVHWFNPFVWLFFKLFSEDMEIVCDECAISDLGIIRKTDYIDVLLGYKKTSKTYSYNVGFSTNSLKKRCINISKLKRCGKTASVTAVIICIMLGIMLCTDAAEAESKVVLPNTSEPASVTEYETESAKQEEDITITDEKVEKHETHVNTNINKPVIKSGYEDGFTDITAKQMEYENISIDIIKDVLFGQGVTYDTGDRLELSKEFAIKDFSYNDNLSSEIKNVVCDANSNISLYFQLNTECFVWVSFYDAESGEKLTTTGILANSKNVYSFIGCDKSKSYDIKIESPLGGTWEISGQYIIY